ncbi:MAG: hypothetical protein GF344_16000 [Chitinivibrionales bacterium]|nr:hypothetical protein [Chitinivibrionales bacterium]MBD3358198.1 hypothetical protein [Chitinivibrionales bacterium]
MLERIQKRAPSRKKLGNPIVVDAVLIPGHNLTALVALQNLLAFSISCLEDCAEAAIGIEEGARMTAQCTKAMQRVQEKSGGSLPPQIESVLMDSIVETEEIHRKLAPTADRTPCLTAELSAAIEAKAYKMRYLSNILVVEIARLKTGRFKRKAS